MRRIIFAIILFSLLIQIPPVKADVAGDALLYERYELYLKYQKKKKYGKYKDYLEVKKKYGFDSAAKRTEYKDAYEKYRQFKKDPKKFYYYEKFLPQYKAYKKYKEVKEYSRYKNYKKYNNKKYNKGKNYGGSNYKAGHLRYKNFTRDIQNVTTNTGPEIKVGLWSKNVTDAENDPFKITANKPFAVSDCASAAIGTVPVEESARIAYLPGAGETPGQLRAYNSNVIPVFPETLFSSTICFQAADGNDSDIIFDVNTPSNLSKGDYDRYRGEIKIQVSATQSNYDLYTNTGFPDNDPANALRRIWVINMLPLEHYMWGYGEMKGGVENHSKALSVTARSYARWYIAYATKWDDEGFDILSYAFSQIYSGYDYEEAYPLVADAARKTNGIIMKYGSEYVLGTYSSYTDGNTRSLDGYPYLVSVPDPYGKNSSMTTEQMEAAGNHMWGLSASGSLVLARDHGWQWSSILSYYYSKIDIVKEY